MKNTFRMAVNHLLIKKLIILFLGTFSLIFCVHFCFFYEYSTSGTNFSEIPKQKEEPLPYKRCSSLSHPPLKTNIFFLKTHKTGSSTVQNIIMRFGIRRSLNFLLPKKFTYLGYTTRINRSILGKELTPSDGKFNIFTHHTRYNNKTNEFLYPDTVRVTTLRNPAHLFESVFNYFNLQKWYNITLSQLLSSLPQGVKLPLRPERRIQGHNQMSRDLGLENEYYNDEAAIESFIRTIDAEFDFVMIHEYFEASLVLLANLMGWPLHYVSFIPLNVRKQYAKYHLTPADEIKLHQFNHADHKLYEHFLKKFRTCLIEYGRERIIKDVQKLQHLNENLRRRCSVEENHDKIKKRVVYTVSNNSNWECVYSIKLELPFTNELRETQIKRLASIKRLQNFIDAK